MKHSSAIRRYILENDPTVKSVVFHGVPIDIEWEEGTVRTYPGSPYSNLMNYDYGYIRNYINTEDGMEADVCLKDENGPFETVYKLAQLNAKTGEFDEWKYMLGFDSEEQAKDCYIKTMEPKMFGWIEPMPWHEFLVSVVGKN